MSRGIIICSQCSGLIHGPHLVEQYKTRPRHFCNAFHAYRFAYEHIPKRMTNISGKTIGSMDAYKEGYAEVFVSNLAKTAK